MKLRSKALRVGLGIVVVTTAFVERPPRVRPEVFILIVLSALIIANLAFSWGQHLARSRSPGTPRTPGAVAPGQSDGAVARTRKPWLVLAMGFLGATGLGIAKAHETAIWLFIPVGILVGSYFVYFVLKKFR
jgi:hypothetical protein